MIRRERQVEAPIIASHRVSNRVLEFTLSDVGEPLLPADRIRRLIRDRRVRVKKSAHMLAPKPGHQHRQGLAGQASALIRRKDHPPGLIDEFVSPCLVPITDVADNIRRGTQNNLEHRPFARYAGVQKSRVRVEDLLVALGAAKVPHHHRVGKQPLGDPEIIIRPREQFDHCVRPSYLSNLTISSTSRRDRRRQRKRRRPGQPGTSRIYARRVVPWRWHLRKAGLDDREVLRRLIADYLFEFDLIRVRGDGWSIAEFAVVPEQRGAGVGRTAVDAVAGRARAAGAEHLEAKVHLDNRRALPFWLAVGFREVATPGVIVTRRNL
jgi:GNAT superfamily N-acetyltransferase